MDILQDYGNDIKRGESTPTEAALVYVMEEIRRAGSRFSDETTNVHEKKFVLALAKLHNQIGKKFKGDWHPMDVDLVGKYIDQELAKYKQMLNVFTAVSICEGMTEPESKEQYIEAWQLLIDTGYAWTLQGWFGRRAVELIEAGYCTK